jgi:hypothetical protein
MKPQHDGGIGTLNEKPLHAALKQYLSQPDDQFEVPVDGYVVDIVRGDWLIEIQTRNFSAMKRKLADLVQRHKVHLVHPVAQEKWIVKENGRRKSPKRGTVESVFAELVSFPQLLLEPNFSLEVLLIREEETRRYEATGSWRRRGWVTEERQLLEVVSRHEFATTADLRYLLPPTLPTQFTTAHLAKAIKQPRALAQKMAYCLRHIGVIEPVGKEKRAVLYAKTAGPPPA